MATRFLEEVDMAEDIRKGCIDMCKEFHTTTRELSERYFMELERHNYVTPTSYLELINTFKTLLDSKRESVTPHSWQHDFRGLCFSFLQILVMVILTVIYCWANVSDKYLLHKIPISVCDCGSEWCLAA